MKNLRYIFALTLIIMSGNLLAGTPTKCTSTSDLVAGDTYYISKESSYSTTGNVMGFSTGGNNFPASTFNDAPCALTLGGNATEGWYFSYNKDNVSYYLTATSSSDNRLKALTTLDAYCRFSISFSDGKAIIDCTGKETYTHLRFNNSSNLYACYNTNQTDIYLYKEPTCTKKITITKGAESNGTFTISPVGENICADDPVTVSVTSITPASGYVASVITTSASGTPSAIANGAGTVTGITASTEINVTFSPKEPATLTKSVLGTTSSMGLSDYYVGDQYELPDVPKSEAYKEGYVFYGWSTTPFSESEYDSQTIYKAGDKFTLTQATQTLYAVYAVQEGTPVISWNDFTSDNTMSECTFVIAGKVNNTYYAMKNNFGVQKYNTYEEVTLTDGHLLADEVADYAVTFEKTSYGATYKIKSNSLASNQYLHGKSSDNELGKGTADADYNLWQVTTGTNGTYNIANYNLNSSSNLVANDNRRLICRTGEYPRFADYQSSDGTEYYDCEIIPVGSGYTYSKFATRFITYQNFAYKCTYNITYTLGDGHAWAQDYEAPATYDHNKNGEAITLPIADNLADGQYFRGWYNNADLTGDPITSLAVTGNGDTTFYAAWASVVNFHVQGEIATTQTINNDGKVTGYTPTATCTGKQFMGWSRTNQTTAVEENNKPEFVDLATEEFTEPTDLYAVYASVNGGKVIGEEQLTFTEDFTYVATTLNYDVDKYWINNGVTWHIVKMKISTNGRLEGNGAIYYYNSDRETAYLETTSILHDVSKLTFDMAYETSGATITVQYKKPTDLVWSDGYSYLPTTTRSTYTFELPKVADYQIRLQVKSKMSKSYLYLDNVKIYTKKRAIWYSDYSTSCDMAESATVNYNNIYSHVASSVGETVTISNYDAKNGYQVNSLTIQGVTYNVGDKYILAHDVTPEAADIRPVMTWTERYASTWSQPTTPDENGKLVLPETQPASFAPGLYEFYGWTTESFDKSKTAAPAIVSAETDAPATPTTYYAVYRKQNNTGEGYTYRQTTPSPLYQLTYSPNGGTGSDYVVYTDLSTSTTPASTLFTREGATLVGWTLEPNAETIEYVGTSTRITGINGDRHYYAVWIGKLEMNKTIALTSAYGATVGSASFTLSSKNLGTITALRFAYHDVDNNIWYRTSNRSNSEFRLCNPNYSLTNAEDNVNVSTSGTNFSKDYAIVYTPNSGNKMSHYQLVVELMNKNTVMAADTFDLIGRSLPDQFVIATQKDSKWYALQANMTQSGTWAGVEINVEGTGTEMVAFASDTLLYSLRTYNYDKSHVLFQSNVNDGHLWASTGEGTDIRDYATGISGEQNEYAWLLTSENDLLSYTICNKQDKPNHQYLGMNSDKMGMYQLITPMQFYFLPLGFTDTIVITTDSTLHTFDGQNLSHADVVVKPNGTLTIDKSVTVRDVTVETGGKLNITNETFTINRLHLEGGWDEEHTSYDIPYVYIAPEASLVKTIDCVNLDMRVDQTNYYPFAVPFPVKVSDVDYVDATLANASTYGTHYVIKTYDGARRAANRMDKENNWVAVPADATLQPGVGYILTAVTVDGFDKRLRFPMTFSNDWTANGEHGEVAEVVKNKPQIYQYESGIHPCHSGWNMVAVPFMSAYGDGENTVLGGVTYVTIPTHNFDEYKQVQVKDTILRPEWSFFIQAENNGTLNFQTEQERLLTSPLMAPQRVDEVPEYAVAMRLSGSTTSDKTTLKVSDRYTTDYEIGADLEKMFGNAYTLATYTLMDGTRLAFNALDTEHAGQPIAVGYRVPETGDYTFSAVEKSDLSHVAHLYLTDYETGITTDLLNSGYTFTSARTQEDGRFVLNVQMRAPETPTALDEAFKNAEAGTQKVVYQGKLFIIDKGVVYDGQGKRVMMK